MFPSDYALQAVKGIKESFDNGVKEIMSLYGALGIVDMYTTDQIFEIYTSTESLSGTIQLGVLEAPPSSKLEDGYSVTITEDRFGNAIELPEQVYRRDGRDSTLRVSDYLMRQRNALLQDVANRLITDYHLFFNDAFAGTFLLAPDGQPLLDGAHAWATPGAATWDNSDTQALDSDAIDTMETYAGGFLDGSGKPMPISFDTIVVKKGSAASRTAIRLFASQITPTQIDDVNIYYGQYTIVETPYITNPLFWFGLSTKGRFDNPMKLGIGEAPTLREPIIQNNEAIRTNCTGFWKKGIVNMPIAVYGSNGTT